jgi:hypothetical protein
MKMQRAVPASVDNKDIPNTTLVLVYAVKV